MAATSNAVGAAEFLPARRSLRNLRTAAAGCRGCDLYEFATQTVFGEGAARARCMLVGEQPGDSEDRLGHPFVGPAGKMLHQAIEAAGLSERDVYVTNAVKHFKFVVRGKRRIHAKPRAIEIRACRPWLEAELKVIRPELVVALGATAAQALFGSSFRLMANRGRVFDGLLAMPALATIHPSAILRAPDADARHEAMASFIEDLRAVNEVLNGKRKHEKRSR
ncbi:MAG: UdgX family uracil-DNA binding protein [Candidatus Cybelea sp.]